MYGLLGLDNIGWDATIWKSGIGGCKKAKYWENRL